MNDKPKRSPETDDVASWSAGQDPNNEIGSKLKAFYSSLQEEPIPDRFLDLLEKLDESERGSPASRGTQGNE